MKKLTILALIALGCAVKQEVRYTRLDWPTPEEIKRDLKIPETDPLQAFPLDSTLTLKPLDSTEIAVLDSARLAYFDAIKDSFPDMSIFWWGSSVRSWIYHTYDSLEMVGKSPATYYYHLEDIAFNIHYDNWTSKMDSKYNRLFPHYETLETTFAAFDRIVYHNAALGARGLALPWRPLNLPMPSSLIPSTH